MPFPRATTNLHNVVSIRIEPVNFPPREWGQEAFTSTNIIIELDNGEHYEISVFSPKPIEVHLLPLRTAGA